MTEYLKMQSTKMNTVNRKNQRKSGYQKKDRVPKVIIINENIETLPYYLTMFTSYSRIKHLGRLGSTISNSLLFHRSSFLGQKLSKIKFFLFLTENHNDKGSK